ncbi:MAG TPA: GIY-YIG nuclease family protein [Nitrolancea sp.]
MTDRSRRRELKSNYKETHREASVYALRNQSNGKVLIGSTLNLASMRNKLEFARSTNSPGALDLRLRHDIETFGIDAFELEILDSFQPSPEKSDAEIRKELEALEELYREEIDPAFRY